LLGSVLRPVRGIHALCAWLLLHLAFGTTIWLLSPGAETVWFHLGRWLTGIQDADSWEPMEIAWRRAAQGANGLYGDVFFRGSVKFQYPLTALTLAGGVSRPVLNVLTWCATVATAFLSALVLRATIRAEPRARDAGLVDEVPLTMLFAMAVLVSYPVLKGYSLGQIQAVVTALFAALLLAWVNGRSVVAGVALGLMLLIKPAAAPLLLWGLVRRKWRFAAAAGVTLALGGIVSFVQFPVREHVAYIDVLSYIGQRGELFYPNQSLNGLLNRWVAGGGSLVWTAASYANANPLVATVTTGGFLVAVALALLAVPRPSHGSALDLSVMMLAATLSAPVAWEHHYGVLAPIVAAGWPAIVVRRPFGAVTGVVLAGSALIAANFVQAANRFDGTLLNPLQSYLFAAACTLWVMLLRATRLPAWGAARQ
jgi:alpha-1,2-mannosyltransferase